MSKTIYITDTTFNDGNTCTRSYYVELKLASQDVYQPLQDGLQVQYASPIQVPALDEDETYNIRITRTCCDGSVASPVVVTMLTTQLGAPGGFNATPGNTLVDLAWDATTGATGYQLERGEEADYSDAVEIYNGPLLVFEDTGLTNGTIYYYRVRAYSAVKLASDYSLDSATPTP